MAHYWVLGLALSSAVVVWLLFNWRVAVVWVLSLMALAAVQMSLLTYAILIAARLMNGDVDVSYL